MWFGVFFLVTWLSSTGIYMIFSPKFHGILSARLILH